MLLLTLSRMRRAAAASSRCGMTSFAALGDKVFDAMIPYLTEASNDTP